MERVQITGQAGDGQYYDNKGRLLYAMGDINITPGMWVWTNGKTIYGHQTAGEWPINIIDRPVLPIPGYIGITEPDKKTGALKQFVSKYGAVAYVGDAAHAYIQLYNNEWINVITGDNLGAFSPVDACIGNDGSLLTIEQGTAYFSDDGAKKTNKVGVPALIANSLNRVNVWDWDDDAPAGTEWNVVRANYPYRLEIDRTEYNRSYNEYYSGNGQKQESTPIKIRKNGKIVKEIDLSGYIEDVKTKISSRLKDIHNKNSGRNSKKVYGIVDSNKKLHDISYGGKIRPWPNTEYNRYWYGDFKEITLDRPDINYSVNINTDALKINKDGSFFAILSIYAGGVAFPFIKSYDSKFDMTPVKPHFYYKWTWPNGSKGPFSKETIYNGDMPEFRFKNTPDYDWVPVYANYGKIIILPDGKTTSENESIHLNDGVFMGPMTPWAGDANKIIKFLPGYDLDLIQLDGVIGNNNQFAPKSYYAITTEQYEEVDNVVLFKGHERKSRVGVYTLYVAGRAALTRTTTAGYSGQYTLKNATSLNNYIDTRLDKVKANSSQTLLDANNGGPITLMLDNRFKIEVEFSENNINNPKTVHIYDGEKIITNINQNDECGFVVYYWWLIKAGVLSPGKYIVTIPQSGYPPIIINNGTAEAGSQSIYTCYTLEYFKSRKFLAEKLNKILS